MLGFVRDPDTNGPALGPKVQLVYDVADLIGRKSSTVRDALVDSAGLYKICGLPADMSGKVQVFRNGVSSGEVPVEAENGLAVRAFSIVARHEAVAEVKNDSGKVLRVAKGSARVTGKVTDKNGRPLEGARVTLQGASGGATVISRANGEFALDSLPSGTQALVVRKLGYAVTEQAVELSSIAHLADGSRTHVHDHRCAQRGGWMCELLARQHAVDRDDAGRYRRRRQSARDRGDRGLPRLASTTGVHQAGAEWLRGNRHLDGRQSQTESRAKAPPLIVDRAAVQLARWEPLGLEMFNVNLHIT
ncbi:MAG TPA: carboxypeptidase-like regulatory domain-containing protein [Gemmatimonadaceae bacterium]|jgi:hypothetical protein